MHFLSLKNITLEDTPIESLHVYIDDEGSILILPMLWMIHLSATQSVIRWQTIGDYAHHFSHSNKITNAIRRLLSTEDVSDNTIDNYSRHFHHFLIYINSLNKRENTPNVHNTEKISSKFLNHYFNTILPKRLKSVKSLIAHQAAVTAYYNFLYELGIKHNSNDWPPVARLFRKTRQKIAEEDDRLKKINYVSREDRSLMLRTCSSCRDRLILRMGFEVGLRAEENTGLILGSHKAKLKNQKGLLSLFEEAEKYPKKRSFEFLLNGKYTKGGRSRLIYFDRELLISIKHYVDNERKQIINEAGQDCDSLFVRTDRQGKGTTISKSQASTTFRKIKELLPHLNETLSYHDLRHTFATELYHTELQNPDGRETRSESAALFVVSVRLGHKNITSSKRYIRLSLQLKIIENQSYENLQL